MCHHRIYCQYKVYAEILEMWFDKKKISEEWCGMIIYSDLNRQTIYLAEKKPHYQS